MSESIYTTRLLLRTYVEADRAGFVALNGDPLVRQHMDGPLQPSAAEALFDRLIPLLMSNGGDQDAAYRSVLGVSPKELTTALDSYALEQLSAAGHELSRQ